MKNNLLKLLAFFISALITASCAMMDEPEIGENQVRVSLKFTGEALVDGQLVTQKGGNDLYGVNIYYDKDGDGSIDTGYGYGLFDNPNLMQVTLRKGYKYKFQYTIVRDAKTRLNNKYGKREGRYGAPFYQEIGNVFILGKETMKGLASGEASLAGEQFYKVTTPLDRFYGEVAEFEPMEDGEVELPVMRTSFGVKFVITGLIEKDNDKFMGYFSDLWDIKTQTNGATYEYICSFPDLDVCWHSTGTYTMYQKVQAHYSSYGTNSYVLKTAEVSFSRNRLTTVYIQCHRQMGAIFSTTEEDLPL
ncbi:MAG: hypothetical protein J6R57_03575 [Bacteroidales bacterium]|nr:hypothetical protein [Bacteroidales bacterium]